MVIGSVLAIIIFIVIVICTDSREKKEKAREEQEKRVRRQKREEKIMQQCQLVLKLAELQCSFCFKKHYDFKKGCVYNYASKDNLENDKVTMFYVDGDNKGFLVGAGQVVILKGTDEVFIRWSLHPWGYSFAELIDFSVFDNGSQYIAGDVSGAVGGAVIGRILGGEQWATTGAVIGAAGAVRSVEQECHELGLALRLNDLEQPFVKLHLLEQSCNRNSDLYRQARDWVDDVAALLAYIKYNA